MYKILAMGDSVMWGQGLRARDRYTFAIRRHVASRTGLDLNDVTLDILAHSGAKIGLNPQRASDAVRNPFLWGEIPVWAPNLHTQLNIVIDSRRQGMLRPPSYRDYLTVNDGWDPPAHQERKRTLARHFRSYARRPPDLILVNGGINDLDAFQILSPFPTANLDKLKNINEGRRLIKKLNPVVDRTEFEALVRRFCLVRMRRFLKRLRDEFEDTPIIVTGYYPLITRGSKNIVKSVRTGMIISALASGAMAAIISNPVKFLLISEIIGRLGKRFLVDRSFLWTQLSSRYLAEAAQSVPNAFVAVPRFGDEHGIYAEASYIWPLLAGRITARPPRVELGRVIDPLQNRRARAVDDWRQEIDEDRLKWATAYIASVGHPNRDGARAYTDAIKAAMDSRPDVFAFQ